MAKTNFQTIDEYIDTFPADDQAILQTIRQAIHEAVPDAQEVISYQIPAFKSSGWIFYMSMHPNHYSLSCPPPFTVFDRFSDELSRYKRSKSTIRFPKAESVPVELIRAMATFRASELSELREHSTKESSR